MESRASTLLTQVLLVAAGVGGYHLAVSRAPAPFPRDDGRAGAPAPTGVSIGTEPAPHTGPELDAPDSLPSVAALMAANRQLEDRLSALENRIRAGLSVPRGTDGEGLAMPTAPAAGASRPTDPEVARFEDLLRRVESQRARERDEATWRRRLKNASIALPLVQEDEFVALAAGYQESIRDLFPGGSGGGTAEERQATLAKMEELRGALLEKLRNRFPNLATQDIEKLFPPAPTKPMERAGPADPAAMGR